MSLPRRQWFQPGDGIAREVITADIQRYLGNDALVKPGKGTAEYEGVDGYWITAYRNLTSQMVQDLQLDSQRWRQEVQQGRVAYQDSTTHRSRQYYGPTTPAPDYAQPPPTSYSSSSHASHSSYPTRSPAQPSYPETAYTHTPQQAPPGYVYQGGQYVPAPGYGSQAPRTQPQVQYTSYGQPPREQESPYPPQPQQAYYTPSSSAPPRTGYAAPQPSYPAGSQYDERAYTQHGRHTGR